MQKELFCQLCDCDDEFDGYNHYTISFFRTFTSLEFFLLNGNVHQENVFEEEIMNKKRVLNATSASAVSVY